MSKKVYVDLSQQDVQDFINAYEKDIEKFNKQKEVLDKIKKDIKEELENVDKDLIMMNLREKERLEWYLELLEEIE